MNVPSAIKKLDEAVINRIAAGEVIQRPANALKEMIENCIDAKANNILISVKDGGLKYLQISDNGTGIRREDFPIVCERFTTSKLEQFEDLHKIKTYGFRGEALASISHVAHLTIQSKTVNSDCAYKASYVDSKLKGPPKPCAGNQGTTVTVEDLFYNMATRRCAMRNAADEFSKISDVIGKYAVHNASVGFTLKKYGRQNNSIKTPPNSTRVENIRIVYGNEVARHVSQIECTDDDSFKLHGYVTSVHYSQAKRGTFLLFINDRLVQHSVLKRHVESVYEGYLPRGSRPFVYLSVQLEPSNVDVNVHPTKQQVHFLHEEHIVEKIAGAVEARLLDSNDTLVFRTEARLAAATTRAVKERSGGGAAVQDNALVRTDSARQKLDKWIVDGSVLDASSSSAAGGGEGDALPLTSVLELRRAATDECHRSLRALLAEHVFVGCVGGSRNAAALLQHGTRLYLCDTRAIMREFFAQCVYSNFGRLGVASFASALPLSELAALALDLPDGGWTEADGRKDELARGVAALLVDKRDMLREYFSLLIDERGLLRGVPLLLDGHAPSPAGLPLYVLRLATEVDWSSEKRCFKDFARETARYYAEPPPAAPDGNARWLWTVEHVLYPAVKRHFLPPKRFVDTHVILQLAALPNLYKVFERC